MADWQDDWKPVIDAVGTDFGEGSKQESIEDIEKSTIRRYCEPLEMDFPLFYDEAAAKAQGFKGIPAPYSGISQTWIDGGVWKPGDRDGYPAAERNAPIDRDRPGGAKRPTKKGETTSGGFATSIEIEFFEPAVVGDRLHKTGDKLLSCDPKETRVGKGAFTIYESEIRNQDDVLIAKLRSGGYAYIPNV
jgi:hypothetical protein